MNVVNGSDRISRLLASLVQLRAALDDAERGAGLDRQILHPVHRLGAANLVHYLELRRHDIRALQDDLARLGLSSLGRAEAHVRASLDQVLAVLAVLEHAQASAGPAPADGGAVVREPAARSGAASAAPEPAAPASPARLAPTPSFAVAEPERPLSPHGAFAQVSDGALARAAWSPDTEARLARNALAFDEGRRRLARNAAAALGPEPVGRNTRIMVTLPSQAAVDPSLVRNLIARGMDCARINCAHDDPAAWEAMIAHVRAAAGAAGRPCPVVMDLSGPKLRTAGLEPAPGVVRLRPARDRLGRVRAPASGWLLGPGAVAPPQSEPRVPVAGDWLAGLREGAAVQLRDARGKRRTLRVVERGLDRARFETDATTYLIEGIALRARHGEGRVGPLPARALPLVLRAGDRITLTPDGGAPDRIGCTLPEVIGRLRRGHRVWFDDGKIGGVVTAVRPGEADIEITAASPGGTKLRARKSINLPDTDLLLPSITADDEAALPFVAAHADLAGMSFVHRPEDVRDLQARLDQLGATDVGVLLKIETAEAFVRLPDLMLAAMANPRVAVMIARGDLAVESGWERLAEVQEEILWLAEAAHVPVIWATEVLDRLARTGKPSRPEITDAAMSQRAECVMLNKGPYIETALTTLDNILRRMSAHQAKKSALLRRLRSWAD